MKTKAPIRVVGEYVTGNNKRMKRIHIPSEMGLNEGDIILFEKKDDKTVIMHKLP